MTKTTFFIFIFPIPLSCTSRPSFSLVLCANQKLEQKTCNTRATLLWPHLRCDTWDVRKFVFHPKKSRQFLRWKSAFFLYWIFISNLLYFIIGVIVKLLFNMVCCRPRHVESPCGNLGPGVFVVVVRPARNWSAAGYKRRKRKICCFYKDKFISRRDVEHLGLR